MKTNIPQEVQEKIANMSEEGIRQILDTKTSAADIAARLEEIKKQLTSHNQVEIEGWVARDSNGDVNIFDSKPHLTVSDFWMNDGCYYLIRDLQYQDSNILPSLTFENSPRKVRITITPIEE